MSLHLDIYDNGAVVHQFLNRESEIINVPPDGIDNLSVLSDDGTNISYSISRCKSKEYLFKIELKDGMIFTSQTMGETMGETMKDLISFNNVKYRLDDQTKKYLDQILVPCSEIKRIEKSQKNNSCIRLFLHKDIHKDIHKDMGKDMDQDIGKEYRNHIYYNISGIRPKYHYNILLENNIITIQLIMRITSHYPSDVVIKPEYINITPCMSIPEHNLSPVMFRDTFKYSIETPYLFIKGGNTVECNIKNWVYKYDHTIWYHDMISNNTRRGYRIPNHDILMLDYQVFEKTKEGISWVSKGTFKESPWKTHSWIDLPYKSIHLDIKFQNTCPVYINTSINSIINDTMPEIPFTYKKSITNISNKTNQSIQILLSFNQVTNLNTYIMCMSDHIISKGSIPEKKLRGRDREEDMEEESDVIDFWITLPSYNNDKINGTFSYWNDKHFVSSEK